MSTVDTSAVSETRSQDTMASAIEDFSVMAKLRSRQSACWTGPQEQGLHGEVLDAYLSKDSRVKLKDSGRKAQLAEDLSVHSQVPLGTGSELFVSLQSWSGYVIGIEESSFAAKLTDLTNPNAREDAEFPLEAVSNGDKHLLEDGAPFYWHIGYRTDSVGQKSMVSELKFRRLPPLSDDIIARATDEAKSIKARLG